MKTLISILIVSFASIGGFYLYQSSTRQNDSPQACTLEAMICPDGSAVGRTGPNCEFAKCPLVDMTEKKENVLTIGGVEISIEIADTPEERQQGLSGRASLAEDAGMLFVFDTSGKYSFWMKDTLIPLDIIWIDDNKKIVHIEKNVMPDTYPQTFTSPVPARYVLEVQAGFSEQHQITKGDLVLFSLNRGNE